jgi:PAS domain S-box-containing protein
MDIEQAREILDLAQSAFISIDEDGRITYWNIRAEEMFGLPRAQAVGRVLAETIIPERYRERHAEGLRGAFRPAAAEGHTRRGAKSVSGGDPHAFARCP